MVYDNTEKEVKDFQVPELASYESFDQKYKENVKLEANSTNPVILPSFYLPEGKYENAEDVNKDYKTSYKTAITLDTKDNSGVDLGAILKALPPESSLWKVSFRTFLFYLVVLMWW